MSFALICHFFNVPYELIGELPITTYRKMLDQAINIGNWRSGGKFELLDTEDKDALLNKEYEDYKKFMLMINENGDNSGNKQ